VIAITKMHFVVASSTFENPKLAYAQPDHALRPPVERTVSDDGVADLGRDPLTDDDDYDSIPKHKSD